MHVYIRSSSTLANDVKWNSQSLQNGSSKTYILHHDNVWVFTASLEFDDVLTTVFVMWHYRSFVSKRKEDEPQLIRTRTLILGSFSKDDGNENVKKSNRLIKQNN